MNEKIIDQDPVDVQLPADTEIFLTILIGYAQMGASLVKFKDVADPLAKGTITHLQLGNSEALRGRTLMITSKVLDANDATLHYIVTHDFSSGVPKHFVESGSFSEQGQLLIWNTTYNFN